MPPYGEHKTPFLWLLITSLTPLTVNYLMGYLTVSTIVDIHCDFKTKT